jgi:hypothetical protein
MAPFGGLQWGPGAKAASKDLRSTLRKWQLSRREAPFGDRHWFQWRHLGGSSGDPGAKAASKDLRSTLRKWQLSRREAPFGDRHWFQWRHLGGLQWGPGAKAASKICGLHSGSGSYLGGRRHLAIDIGSNGAIWGLQWGSGAKAASKDLRSTLRKWQLSRREAPFGDRHWFQWRHLGGSSGDPGAKAASKDLRSTLRKWQLSRREAPFGDRHWFQWRHLGGSSGDPAPRRRQKICGLHSGSGSYLGGRRHLAIDIGSNGAIWGAPVGIRRQGGVKRFAVYTRRGSYLGGGSLCYRHWFQWRHCSTVGIRPPMRLGDSLDVVH